MSKKTKKIKFNAWIQLLYFGRPTCFRVLLYAGDHPDGFSFLFYVFMPKNLHIQHTKSYITPCQMLLEVKLTCFFSLSLICFHQRRFSQHGRPGGQGQLRPPGSDSGSQVDQRKHPGLQRRPKTSDHFWLWRRCIVRQPAHPLALLRRYVRRPRGHSLSRSHAKRLLHHCHPGYKCANPASQFGTPRVSRQQNWHWAPESWSRFKNL